jgi:DNA-binding NtrC family response regulator
LQKFKPDCRVIVDAADLASSNNRSAIHVLHVDDDPSILEISKQILMDVGNFEIDHACCVDEAFKKLATGQYDVVISDYEMPQKNGLQFLTELRKQNNEIPFVLFTGKGREEVAIKALNVGAAGYYNKQGSPETVYGELAHGIKLSVERKKADEVFKKQAALIDLSPDAVIVKKLDETITFWNAGAERLYGYTKEEALGQKINIRP